MKSKIVHIETTAPMSAEQLDLMDKYLNSLNNGYHYVVLAPGVKIAREPSNFIFYLVVAWVFVVIAFLGSIAGCFLILSPIAPIAAGIVAAVMVVMAWFILKVEK